MTATGIANQQTPCAGGWVHTWTADNRLRHPRFAGIRSDKDAREVTRE